jgi:hypothetical protein
MYAAISAQPEEEQAEDEVVEEAMALAACNPGPSNDGSGLINGASRNVADGQSIIGLRPAARIIPLG